MWQRLILTIACIMLQQQHQQQQLRQVQLQSTQTAQEPSATIATTTTTTTTTIATTTNDNEIFLADDEDVPVALISPSETHAYTLLMAGGVPVPQTDPHYYTHYMVSLRSRHNIRYFGDNHFCAGTIISANIVLTAAHCVMDKRGVLTRPRRMVVIAGTPFRTHSEATTLSYDVAALVPQPSNQHDHSNKLAIVRIVGAFPHGNINLREIYLPTIPPPYEHNCTTAGWGRIYYRGPLSDAALHVNVTLLQPEACEQLRSDTSTVGLLCAATAIDEYDCDTCPGDAGGPLICDGQLTGIVAWNLLCGNVSLPSLFIAVQPQIEWILSIMSDSVQSVRLATSELLLAIAVVTLVF